MNYSINSLGIIKRQSIKFSAVNFLGTIFGGLSILFIYSLDDELYGYAQMLISLAYLFVPLAGLGIGSVAVRYFREFKNGNDNNGFLTLLLVITLITNLLFALIYFIFKESFYKMVAWLGMNDHLLRENELVFLLLVAILNLLSLFVPYISNYRRIVIPTLVQNLGYKIFLPIIFLLVFFGVISKEHFSFLIPSFYFLTLVILVFYLKHIGGLHLSWKPSFYRKKIKSIKGYLLYTGATSLGNSLTYRLDSVMVSLIIGLQTNGFYNKVAFMSNVIGIPTNSINQISNPIISESIKKNDIGHIEQIYKKSSANLFLIGAYLYVLMMYCLPSLFALSSNPQSFKGSMIVFLFLGGAKLVDMITSVNGAIIGFSNYYRYNLYFILFLGLLNVILNYVLINQYGVVGAAIASFIALCCFNFLKALFIYAKFKIHPFSNATYKVLLLMVISFFGLRYLQFNLNPILLMGLNFGILSVIYGIGVKYLRVTQDSVILLESVSAKIKSLLTRNS